MQKEVNSKIKTLIKQEIEVMEHEWGDSLSDYDQISIRIILDKPNDLYTKQYYKNFEFDEIFEIIHIYLRLSEKDFTMDVNIQIT